MTFICYPKCTTCQKAKEWLLSHHIQFDERNIKEENPTIIELTEWHKKSEKPLKRFFNTSGLIYKDLKLKDKLPTMTEQEQLELLASNGMLVKRPLIIADEIILIGFNEKEWEKLI